LLTQCSVYNVNMSDRLWKIVYMVRALCELEITEGLTDVARKELIEQIGRANLSQIQEYKEAIQFTLKSDVQELLSLKTAASAYIVHQFDIPRPKALLGHQNFTQLLKLIKHIRELHPINTFNSLYLSAAGSNSSVMQRIKEELSQATGLVVDDSEGDLLIRIRRTKNSWDVLVRLTPRPLATRGWRVVDLPGALNAPVAHVMARLAGIKPHYQVLNLMCGSASLVIEAHSIERTARITGVDLDTEALNAAHINAKAARIRRSTSFIQGDAAQLPFRNADFDILLADLPFGNLVGSHEYNVRIYPRVFHEAWRVAKPGARFVLITHEVRLMEQILADMPQWQVEDIRKINLRGLHPRIYTLRKSK